MASLRLFVIGAVFVLIAGIGLPTQLAAGTPPPPPPTIVLPAVGATVSGQNVVLDATAPTGTTSVEYKVFAWAGLSHAGLNAPVAYALTPSQYGWFAYWNTTDVPNGSYDLYAVATVNGTSDSSPVSTVSTNVTVDNPPPSVSIGSPSSGAILSGTEDLTAGAPYSGATVSFLLTGASGTITLGESWDPANGGDYPYSFYWSSATVPNGYYDLVAVAEYSGGLSNATSVAIAVDNT